MALESIAGKLPRVPDPSSVRDTWHWLTIAKQVMEELDENLRDPAVYSPLGITHTSADGVYGLHLLGNLDGLSLSDGALDGRLLTIGDASGVYGVDYRELTSPLGTLSVTVTASQLQIERATGYVATLTDWSTLGETLAAGDYFELYDGSHAALYKLSYSTLEASILAAVPQPWYQYVSNNAGATLTQRDVLDVATPLVATDLSGTTTRISLGTVPLSLGGTNANLSATGGTSQFLRQSSAGAAVTVSAIAHADLGSGGGTATKYLRDDMSWQTVSAGVTDHGALTGLSDDDHSIYALLAGRSGGQTLIGGTAASENLILQSTSSGTKGWIDCNGILKFTSVATSNPAQNYIRAYTGDIMYYNSLTTTAGHQFLLNGTGPHLCIKTNGGVTAIGIGSGLGATAAARALEVRSTSAQIRASYDATFYWERGCASDGANKWVTNSTSVGSTELEATRTITGAVTDGYAAGLLLDPGYSGAYTVTRHNYLDCQDVSLAASAVLTDACLVRFDAAAGTHKATVGATTKTTPGGVDAWIKININGTIYYVPAYTSTTA